MCELRCDEMSNEIKHSLCREGSEELESTKSRLHVVICFNDGSVDNESKDKPKSNSFTSKSVEEFEKGIPARSELLRSRFNTVVFEFSVSDFPLD